MSKFGCRGICLEIQFIWAEAKSNRECGRAGGTGPNKHTVGLGAAYDRPVRHRGEIVCPRDGGKTKRVQETQKKQEDNGVNSGSGRGFELHGPGRSIRSGSRDGCGMLVLSAVLVAREICKKIFSQRE